MATSWFQEYHFIKWRQKNTEFHIVCHKKVVKDISDFKLSFLIFKKKIAKKTYQKLRYVMMENLQTIFNKRNLYLVYFDRWLCRMCHLPLYLAIWFKSLIFSVNNWWTIKTGGPSKSWIFDESIRNQIYINKFPLHKGQKCQLNSNIAIKWGPTRR